MRPVARVIAALVVGAVVAAPALVGRLPTGAQDATMASPVAAPACLAQATPVAAAGAQPVTPIAVDPTSLLLQGLVERLVACWNARDWTTYASLLSPDAREARFGTTDIATIARRMTSLAARNLVAPITIDSAQYAREMSEGSALIQVHWRQGYAELHHSWIFQRAGDNWLLENLLPLEQPLDGPAVGLRIVLDDQTGISLPRTEVAAVEFVTLEAVNETGWPFTFTILGYAADLDPAALAIGQPQPAPTPVADLLVASEESVYLVLHDLPPGSYLLVIGLDRAVESGDPSQMRWARLTILPQGDASS